MGKLKEIMKSQQTGYKELTDNQDTQKYKYQIYYAIMAMYLNPWFGLPGLFYSCWAYESFLLQQPELSQKYFRKAKKLNIWALTWSNSFFFNQSKKKEKKDRPF